ncbi:MAG: metallophosphoesterase family protein [Planctomycetota bacterium]|jgi:predicted phosphodiesterase
MMSKRVIVTIAVIIVISAAIVAAVFCFRTKPDNRIPSSSDPVQITRGPYLQFAGDFINNGEIVISWETRESCAPGFILERNHDLDEKGFREVIKRSELPSKVHRVGVVGFSAGAKFLYDVATAGNKRKRSFEINVPPATGEAMKFAVFGDTRSQPKEHKKAANAILREKPAFVIHSGDFVYDGRKSRLWDSEWFEPAKEMLKSIPVVPAIGNHENNAAEYYEIFDVTTGGAPDYAIVIGDVEIVSIDTSRDFLPGAPAKDVPPSRNYSWLKERLEAPRKVKWRIIAMHNPAFSSGNHGPSKNVQYALVPLFSKYQPDVIFSGHDHCYERSEFEGVTYITSAGGGAPLYKKSKKNPYSKVFKSVYHYTLVEIDGDKMKINAKELDGTVIDSYEIARKK